MTFDPPRTTIGAVSAYKLEELRPNKWSELYAKAREGKVQQGIQHPKIGVDTFKNSPKVIEAPPPPKQTYDGRIANYKNSTVFEVPDALCKRMGSWRGIKVRQIGADVWELEESRAVHAIMLRDINGIRKGYMGVSYGHAMITEGKFGMSAAELVWVNNQILATVKERRPLLTKHVDRIAEAQAVMAAAQVASEAVTQARSGAEHLAAAQAAERAHADAVAALEKANDALKDPPPVAPVPAEQSPGADIDFDKEYDELRRREGLPPRSTLAAADDMRDLLRHIRYIEKMTPYRLVKLAPSHDWAFTAPTIK